LGISIIHTHQVLTDNGPCFYRLQFRSACQAMGIKHRRTRPSRPQTNGKAERFIQTAIRKWAYARRYETSARRLEHLQPWTHQYTWHRPHATPSTEHLSMSTTC
jgi:transposase InsO family protein